ncbi:RNA polymerase factor sigma-54 [Alphaproteobacteria bacterium]|nr:RNA polymerase factor sigma-54 [Alphaproteobacteria bacterium]
MALTPRLGIKNSQSLALTPQLKQSIKMLQLSSTELINFVADEVDNNPLLEYDEKSFDEEAQLKYSNQVLQNSTSSTIRNDEQLNEGYQEFYEESALPDNIDTMPTPNIGLNVSNIITNSMGNFDSVETPIEQKRARPISLKNHLESQLSLIQVTPDVKIIIQYLIGLMNESGYINEKTSLIAEQCGCTESYLEKIFKIAQSMEPIGVFSRSLGECLKIQQIQADRYDPVMAIFLDHLSMVGEQKFNELRHLCKVNEEDFLDMLTEIKTLNPKPGLKYGEDPVYTIIPDVYVRKTTKGRWFAELNNDNLPKVLINNRYIVEISEKELKKKDKVYIQECTAKANWLIQALDQRAKTILKVSSELVRLQKKFFEGGIQYLAPVNLKKIAKAINMHESTVSRVTTNKYIATPIGIFEMKFLFTNAIGSLDNSNQYSSKSIKYKIKNLINNETPKKILSDDKIVKIIREEGIDIARRTVAKYRESLEIPSSIIRRRIKNPIF